MIQYRQKQCRWCGKRIDPIHKFCSVSCQGKFNARIRELKRWKKYNATADSIHTG